MRNSGGQCINATFNAFGKRKLLSEPIFGNEATTIEQKLYNACHDMGVFGGRNVAVIRQLANFPSAHNILGRFDQANDAAVAADCFECCHICRILRAG